MSKLKSPIDYKSLELELQAALRADELYKLQNDAKLRAMDQRVPTYEHFRQMVNGAHLKPLERKDVKSKNEVPWNPVITKETSASATACSVSGKSKLKKESLSDLMKGGVPNTCEKFLEIWRLIEGYEEKFIYLKSLRNHLQEIFSIEIPPTLFDELINVCYDNVTIKNDVVAVVDILNILSTCNRFRLAINFLDQSEKTKCAGLFEELLVKADQRDDVSLKAIIDSLREAYDIPFV